jgi:hypothetical protein
VTWGGTRRFIGRLLTGCALARYPAYSAARSKVTTSNDDVLLASKRRRHSDPTEASAQPGAGSCPYLQELQAAGCESLRAIAAGLEERGIPAARGGKWSAVLVSRLLEAARSPFGASVAVA